MVQSLMQVSVVFVVVWPVIGRAIPYDATGRRRRLIWPIIGRAIPYVVIGLRRRLNWPIIGRAIP